MRRTPWSLALAYVCAAVAILMVLVMLIRTWDNGEVNRETLGIVKSCTTPGKKCFNEGQKRTGEAVGSINQITLFAAVCADKPGHQTVAQIERCVRTRLAKNAAR